MLTPTRFVEEPFLSTKSGAPSRLEMNLWTPFTIDATARPRFMPYDRMQFPQIPSLFRSAARLVQGQIAIESHLCPFLKSVVITIPLR